MVSPRIAVAAAMIAVGCSPSGSGNGAADNTASGSASVSASGSASATAPGSVPGSVTVSASASASVPGSVSGFVPGSVSVPASASASGEPSDVVAGASATYEKTGPSVIASDSIDGHALRKRIKERIRSDTSKVTVLRGTGPLELGK